MKLKFALLTAAGTFAIVSGAAAQEKDGYYAALGAGVVLSSENNDLESEDSSPAAFDTNVEVDAGVAIHAALGKYFNNNVRGEIEFANRNQEVTELPGDGLGFAGFPSEDILGDVNVSTLMLNVYKDFKIDAAGRLTPYVGIGGGVARIRSEFDNRTSSQSATTVAEMAESNGIVLEDTAHAVAFQGLAGLTFDFSEDMHLTLGYRYLHTGEYESPAYINPPGPDVEVTGEYEAHEFHAGLRWNFGGTSAPAPVAAPAPAPVQFKTCFDGSRIPVEQACPVAPEVAPVTDVDPLIIYFDYDKSNLTSASEALIDAKVEEVMEGDLSGVMVSGNTDTAGSSAYNQALSARRAAVVRDALVSRGIDGSIISVEALGESNPARPTADGVKEPLNRRTEVDFSFD